MAHGMARSVFGWSNEWPASGGDRRVSWCERILPGCCWWDRPDGCLRQAVPAWEWHGPKGSFRDVRGGPTQGRWPGAGLWLGRAQGGSDFLRGAFATQIAMQPHFQTQTGSPGLGGGASQATGVTRNGEKIQSKIVPKLVAWAYNGPQPGSQQQGTEVVLAETGRFRI